METHADAGEKRIAGLLAALVAVTLLAAATPPPEPVNVTVSTIPCRADPLRQAAPRIYAPGSQMLEAPARMIDGSFIFTLSLLPGSRWIAINTDNCRGARHFVMLDSTARRIEVGLTPYAGGHARRAHMIRRDYSLPLGSLVGLLPIPGLTAEVDDGHGKTYGAESDILAYYFDELPPGHYNLTIAGQGYTGKFSVQVLPNTIVRRDIAMNDLTPGT